VLLRIQNLHTYYDEIQALRGISLHVDPGEIVALIGANGAGKTTLLLSISGILNPRRGSIQYKGQEIQGLSPDRIVSMGISQVPEGRQVFASLSVKDNLVLGAYPHMRRMDRTQRNECLEAIYTFFPILKERGRQKAGTLSGGEQQMLAIGRAMMAAPQLLLLDEPSMGLAPIVSQEIFRKLVELQQHGTTILLVEQNAAAAFRVSDRCYVLETGRITLQGPVRDLVQNRDVQRAYLGKGKKEIWE
jgi:branched-chain amino acid transport system ATP-binding protein